jgi:beta-lactam-binding protein with PASTA domain
MNADGSGQENLTKSAFWDEGPAWLGVSPVSRMCHVPNVVHLRLATAKQRIRRVNCTVGRIRKARSSSVGRVLAQSPRPGTSLPRGGRVNLVVGRK